MNIFPSHQVKGNRKPTQEIICKNKRNPKNKEQLIRPKFPISIQFNIWKIVYFIFHSTQYSKWLVFSWETHQFISGIPVCITLSQNGIMHEQVPPMTSQGKISSIQQGDLTKTNYNHNLFSLFKLILLGVMYQPSIFFSEIDYNYIQHYCYYNCLSKSTISWLPFLFI